MLIGILFCLAPNTNEVYVNLTNTQWHLAALSLLILLASNPTSWGERLFDITILVISALSGPFCVLLLPIAAILAVIQRDKSSLLRLFVIASGAIVQAVPILTTTSSTRLDNVPLGASVSALMHLLGGKLILSSLVGYQAEKLYRTPLSLMLDLVAGIIIFQAVRLFRPLRYATAFSALVLAASLSHPIVTPEMPQWTAILILRDASGRYFFIPTLVWLATIATVSFAGKGVPKALAITALTVCILIGIPRDLHIKTQPTPGLHEAMARYDAAPPGTQVSIPVRPYNRILMTK
ncbi:hypothetical protein ACU81Q_16145 [Komagataeibacter melomenusus]